MSQSLIAATAAALIALGGAAQADEVKGRIQSIDATAQTFTLNNGFTVEYDDGINPTHLGKGRYVHVVYEPEGGDNNVTRMTIYQPGKRVNVHFTKPTPVVYARVGNAGLVALMDDTAN